MVRKARRRRSLAVDLIGVVAILGLAVWRTRSEPDVEGGAVAVVAVVALFVGGCTGWLAARNPAVRWPAVTGAAVVLVVFVLLIGARGTFAGTQWAWLLVGLAGMVLGNDLPRVVAPRSPTAADRRPR